MGNTTSLNQLIAKPSSHKIYLVESHIGENLNDKSFVAATITMHSGSVSQANMRISGINGTAFVDFGSGTELTDHLNAYLTITDSAGKQIKGWIKAAGTGETYGSELVNGWTNGAGGFNYDTFTTSGSDITSAIELGVFGSAYKDVSFLLAVGELYKILATLSLTSGTAPIVGAYRYPYASTQFFPQFLLSAGANNFYRTITTIGDGVAAYICVSNNEVANWAISGFSYKKVIAPSTTGATIVSTQGGSTYNWESQEAGFNYNDPSGYTYTIQNVGNAWKLTSYYIDNILLANGKTDYARKDITQIKEDGTALTEKTSASEVAENAGSFWHDITNQILYIRCSDDANPTTHEIIGFFWMYFATEGVIFNNIYYEPYVAVSGIPSTVQKNQSIFWGVSRPGSGTLIFLNHNGYFDMIVAKYIWDNKLVKILLGGDSLPYSEYTTIFTGRIRERKFTRTEFSCLITSPTFDLLRSIPVNNFWKSNFPNLDPSAEGLPIPVYYGVFSAAQAPIVTCINTAYAANTYQFQIADGAIKAITQVYVDYGDGIGWQTIAHGNEDLTNARFTIVAASFVVGTSRVKVAFQGRHSGGTRIERGPYIVEDILTSLCGYASSDLNTASFTESKTKSQNDLNVGIENVQSALTYIGEICKSDFAFFDEDNSGLLRYRTWEPGSGSGATSLNETDILISELPEIDTRWEDLFYKIYVGYSYSYNNPGYLYVTRSNDLSRRKYEKEDYYRHDTCVRSSGDADMLAQRLLFICKNPLPLLTIGLKFPIPTLLQGDILRITMARAPASTGGGFIDKLFEIQGLEKRYAPGGMIIQAYDCAFYGANVGRWMSSAAPNWADSDMYEKEESGYWLNSSGYASTDRSSKDASLWW